MADSIVPKSDISVLNQEIDDEKGYFRVRAGSRVHYLTIFAGVFDETTMCRPHLLVPRLPEFPDDDWTTMDMRLREDGSVETTISSEPLPTIEDDTVWHANKVEVVHLKPTRRLGTRVSEVVHGNTLAIAKIARFSWEIPYVENETFAYSVLQRRAPQLIPKFLGHLTERGRIMGLLLEKVEGEFASIGNRDECEQAMRAVHHVGLIHGDVNRYNFIVERKTAVVKMIDFEHAEAFESELAEKELESLKRELLDESGRGGPAVIKAS